jgi:hypothetical protein
MKKIILPVIIIGYQNAPTAYSFSVEEVFPFLWGIIP